MKKTFILIVFVLSLIVLIQNSFAMTCKKYNEKHKNDKTQYIFFNYSIRDIPKYLFENPRNYPQYQKLKGKKIVSISYQTIDYQIGSICASCEDTQGEEAPEIDFISPSFCMPNE